MSAAIVTTVFLPPQPAKAAAASSNQPASTATPAPREKRQQRGTAPCMTWINPDITPHAVLLCVHGLGLHNGSYRAFGERMASKGVITYAVDVRGFGSWQRAQGREDVNFEDCLEDVRDTLKVIHRAHPGLPVFILGESMGGAIALRATARYPELIDGLISCVPSGERFKQKKTELKVAMRFLQGPNKKFDVGTGVVSQATESRNNRESNDGMKEAWLNDPLARLNLSPKELIQFQRFMNENHESVLQITNRPVLMVQGWEDNLVKWEGTLELWTKLATDDKQIELLPNAKHLIFEESQFNDRAVNERTDKVVLRWIEDHINKKPSDASEPNQSALN